MNNFNFLKLVFAILLFLGFSGVSILQAQIKPGKKNNGRWGPPTKVQPLTPKERQKATNDYKRARNKEVNLNEYLNIIARIKQEKQVAQQKSFCSPILDPSGCNNGDFESGTIDPSFWQFEYGSVDGNGNIISGSFSCGHQPNSDVSEGDSRHTIVSPGFEISGLPLSSVPSTPLGNKYALRIGNSKNGRGAEMVTKTFIVTPSNSILSFDYAVALNDPSNPHSDSQLPAFLVKVFNNDQNQYVPGLVDLDGNGNDFVQSDLNTGFFSEKTISGVGKIVYSDWLCCTVDLSSLLGKKVTVEFITEDCGKGGHFAFAYIDNICNGCGNSPTSLKFNANDSDDCGVPGKICFDYSIPPTGTVQIELKITKNENVVKTLNSPSLSSGNQYCFNISQNDLGAITSGQINFQATGNFTVVGNNGATINLPKQYAGIPNYDVNCPKPPYDFSLCCPPINKESVQALFEHQPTGGLNAPYKLKFTNPGDFRSIMQAYTNYIKSVNPSINKLKLKWQVFEAGTGNSPANTLSLPISNASNWFSPNGGGNSHSNPNPFFSNLLQVGMWYRIEMVPTTEPASKAFDPKGCTVNFYYQNQYKNGKLMGRISNGKQIVKRIDLSKR